MPAAPRPRPAAQPAAARPRGRPRKAAEAPRPYHHGALPEALLAAAERVLQRDGIAGLGLRAIAREAQVSHTAPKHHFGDTASLLSQLAAAGFWRLRDAMLQAMAAAPDALGRRNAIGQAYVRFAYDNPALFGLMFRNEIVDVRHPGLAEASTAAMRVMAPTVQGAAAMPPEQALRLTAEEAVRVSAAWAYAHGLATLLIDGRLRGILKATDTFDDAWALAQAALQAMGALLPLAPDAPERSTA
ncbi:MAG: WHG domain-containing protein [Proteobacteria bacterium]|nr:WHG domain-containing protein [Pseudomonadota bacterium]